MSTGNRLFRSENWQPPYVAPWALNDLAEYPLKVPADGNPTEHHEHRALVEAWRKCKLPPIFAIPNGGVRGATAAAKLKAEGVSRGVPDLYCPAWSLWIELKRRRGGSMSTEQKAWAEYLQGIGHCVIVPRGAREAVEMVVELCR